MSTSLAFQSTTFDVIDRNGQPWIRSKELAQALGYSDDRKVSSLYARHRDEFTESMTVVLNLGTTLIPNEIRLFSLRGCHLLAMFARTPVAKAFRVWVLDVLENLNRIAPQPALDSTATPPTPADRAPLRALVYAWSQACGIPIQALWPQLKAHFQLTSMIDLPVEWIPDALAFAQSKIDEVVKVKAIPAPVPAPVDLRKIGYVTANVLYEIDAKGEVSHLSIRPVQDRTGFFA